MLELLDLGLAIGKCLVESEAAKAKRVPSGDLPGFAITDGRIATYTEYTVYMLPETDVTESYVEKRGLS